MPLAETLQRLKLRHEATPLNVDERLKVARVCNCINIIRMANVRSSGSGSSSSSSGSQKAVIVSPESIMVAYQQSIDLQLQPKVRIFSIFDISFFYSISWDVMKLFFVPCWFAGSIAKALY